MGSVERVRQAAISAGLDMEVLRLGESTRTAEEAAERCGCSVAQIVKSLIFSDTAGERLFLFLISGADRLDPQRAARAAGTELVRADPRLVRELTGFAIGGVAPIGHLSPLPAFADEALLGHDVVWAAAGAHDAVFSAEPAALIRAAGATIGCYAA
jgi:prolyl-tRNA editing enzyme YbaK/EbsC (Cys-tRNA(Pro) deacylase)